MRLSSGEKRWKNLAEKGVKALKTKKISACISKAFYVYSKYEVGESGAKCTKVVLLTQKCRRVELSDFPEKRGSRCFALFTAASRIAERGKRFDRPVSAQHRRQGQSVHPREAPRGAGRDLLCHHGHGLLPERLFRRKLGEVHREVREPALHQDRILLPQKLRAYAGLDKDVVIIGVSNRAEIWNAERWAALEAEELNPENLAAVMEELGF